MRALASGILIVALALCASCARQKPLSPEEAAAERERQLNMITRVYPDKKPQDVIKAADRVFRLADDDYILSHGQNGFQAHRRWFTFLLVAAVMGEDTWMVDVRPEGAGSRIVVTHTAAGSTASAAPVANFNGGMGATMTSTPTMTNMTTGPAPYQLFYSRLEHLLYGKNGWITCAEAKKLFTDGVLEPFCLCANDRTPDGVSAMQRGRSGNGGKDKEYDMGLR